MESTRREETIDISWFTADQLAGAVLSEFTIALLIDPAVAILGPCGSHTASGRRIFSLGSSEYSD